MRIDCTAFSRLRERAADAGSYRCPHCRASAQFRAVDFEGCFGFSSSRLDWAWQLSFAHKRLLNEDEREAFLDFACRGCNWRNATMQEIYVSTDIETDGPVAGKHSMLSLGSAAYLADKGLLSTFSANLEPLPEFIP
ncbi:MAG: hypothetical protein ACOZCP_11460, partial [Pseudomonadota bacterium]